MRENLTEIVFILDRSGSMGSLVSDTIGGYNSFIETQKKEDGEALITTILFDDKYEILHNGVNIKEIKELTNKEYFARGMTAMLDSIGKTINTVGERLSNTNEEYRPSKVIFIITTDGAENSSVEFEKKQIKTMIEHQEGIYNWQFIFLGANIDAVSEAESLGIKGMHASNYTASDIGTRSIYGSLSKTITNCRANGTIDNDWASEIK